MRVFLLETPDDRRIRVPTERTENLLPGYKVVGEVVDALPDMSGGIVVPVAKNGGDGTLLGYMLAEHGEKLIDWLRANGFSQVRKVAG